MHKTKQNIKNHENHKLKPRHKSHRLTKDQAFKLHRFSLHQPSFEHDIVVELFVREMLGGLSEQAVEESENIKQITDRAKSFLEEGVMAIYGDFVGMETDLEYLCMPSADKNVEPLTQPVHKVSDKQKEYKKIYQTPKTPSIKEEPPSKKQILAKLKRQFHNKLKKRDSISLHTSSSKPNHPIPLSYPHNDSDERMNTSLRFFKKFTVGFENIGDPMTMNSNNGMGVSRYENKSSKDLEYVFGSDGKPLKMKRFECMAVVKNGGKKNILMEANVSNLIGNLSPKTQLVKYRQNIAKTEHNKSKNVSETMVMNDKYRPSGEIAEHMISRSMRKAHKGINIREKENKSMYSHSRISVVKLPRISRQAK